MPAIYSCRCSSFAMLLDALTVIPLGRAVLERMSDSWALTFDAGCRRAYIEDALSAFAVPWSVDVH